MKLIAFIRTAYGGFVNVCNWVFQPLILLAIRGWWGYNLMLAGWGKLTNLGNITKFFEQLAIPLPGVNAFMAGAVECFGGALLMIGLASRAASLAITFTMVVAYMAADKAKWFALIHWQWGWDPEAEASIDPVTIFSQGAPYAFLLAALVVLAAGPGVLSLDYLLGRKFGKKKEEA